MQQNGIIKYEQFNRFRLIILFETQRKRRKKNAKCACKLLCNEVAHFQRRFMGVKWNKNKMFWNVCGENVRIESNRIERYGCTCGIHRLSHIAKGDAAKLQPSPWKIKTSKKEEETLQRSSKSNEIVNEEWNDFIPRQYYSILHSLPSIKTGYKILYSVNCTHIAYNPLKLAVFTLNQFAHNFVVLVCVCERYRLNI